MNTQIFVACITAFVTIIGWIATSYISKVRENRTKLLQLRLEHISRQIEELYGPLYSLITQIFMYFDVKERVTSNTYANEYDQNRMNVFVRETYFYQLHNQIRLLIRDKYHLIDENEVPASFNDYLHHSTQETLQIDIWGKLQIDTSYVKGIDWPQQFHIDAKTKLDELKIIYNKLIDELK